MKCMVRPVKKGQRGNLTVYEINGDRTNIQPIFDQYVNQPINGRKNKLYVQLTCYPDDQQINWLTYEVAK